MIAIKIPKFPGKMEDFLGTDGKNEFIDFLNVLFQNQEESVVQRVSDRFDRTVSESISGMRLDMHETITGLRTEMHEAISDLREEMHEEITGLRMEMRQEISGLKIQIADMRAELKSEITSQTKWILTVILAAATLISIIQPVVMKLLKMG